MKRRAVFWFALRSLGMLVTSTLTALLDPTLRLVACGACFTFVKPEFIRCLPAPR